MKILINLLKTCPINSEIYRDSDVDDLVNSIGDVGLLQPIVVTPENIIISGHRRFKAIQSLGWTEVEVEVKEEPPIIKEDSTAPPFYPRVNESLGNKVKTKKKKGVCYVKPCSWLQPPTRVSQSKDRKPITRERNWVGTLFKCIVGCKEGVKYWDDGGNEFDKNLNLISTN